MAAPTSDSAAVFVVRTSLPIAAPPEKVWKILLDFPSYASWNPFIREQILLSSAGKPLSDQSTPTEGTLIAQKLSLDSSRVPSSTPHPSYPDSDSDSYSVPESELDSSSNSSSNSNPDTAKLKPGTPATFSSTEVLTHVDPRARALAWRLASPPLGCTWLLWSERWQVVRALDGAGTAADAAAGGGSGRGRSGGGRASGNNDGGTMYETWELVGGALAYPLAFFMHEPLQRAFDASARALRKRAEKPKDWTWG